MTKKQLIEMVRRVIKEEFDVQKFRDLRPDEQGFALEELVQEEFPSIHYTENQRHQGTINFYFSDIQDNISILKRALEFFKETTHMNGKIGNYDGMPVVILTY